MQEKFNLDDELKRAQIRKIDEEIEDIKERREEDGKQRRIENERNQRESEALIAKYEAERKKLNKDMLTIILTTSVTAIVIIVSLIIVLAK